MADIAEFYPESLINSYPRLKISGNTNISPETLEDPALKLTLLRLLNTPTVAREYKIPRCNGKSRALLSRQTGMDCFDLEPGHIPEVSMPTNEEPKNIYEELEELFVKQNEHIKVLLTSGAGKTDIKPLAILDCLVPNLSIERYYNLLKSSKDIDQYGHYLILMKNQIEFLSIYIIEEDKFEEFETNIHLTAIDKNMVTTIITTVRANIKFIVKALKLTRLEEDKEKLKKWDNRFGNDSGYQGEIRLGKPGRKEFDKNGNPIHFVDSETFSSIKKQIGISEKAVKDNSFVY